MPLKTKSICLRVKSLCALGKFNPIIEAANEFEAILALCQSIYWCLWGLPRTVSSEYFRAQGLVLGIVFGAVVLFFSILLLVAVRRMLGAYDQSYQESKKALGLQ